MSPYAVLFGYAVMHLAVSQNHWVWESYNACLALIVSFLIRAPGMLFSLDPSSVPDLSPGDLNIVVYILGNVLLPFLFGAALTWIFLQFRSLILIVLSLSTIFIFILVRAGFLEPSFDQQKVEVLYEAFKRAVLDFGLVQFLSFVGGLWAGTVNFRKMHRRTIFPA